MRRQWEKVVPPSGTNPSPCTHPNAIELPPSTSQANHLHRRCLPSFVRELLNMCRSRFLELGVWLQWKYPGTPEGEGRHMGPEAKLDYPKREGHYFYINSLPAKMRMWLIIAGEVAGFVFVAKVLLVNQTSVCNGSGVVGSAEQSLKIFKWCAVTEGLFGEKIIPPHPKKVLWKSELNWRRGSVYVRKSNHIFRHACVVVLYRQSNRRMMNFTI